MRTLITPVMATAALILLTGCSAAPTVADPSRLPDTAPAVAATESPDPEATEATDGPDFGERVVNDRGNLVKEIGQLAGLSLSDDDETLTAQFAVTDIVVDIDCTDEYADAPANGHFVGIHLNVETTPELMQNDPGTLSFAHWGWQGYDDNGKRVNDPVGNSYYCMNATDQLPDDIGPGQSVSGWIVLDMPTASGSVALTMGSPAGWEWSY